MKKSKSEMKRKNVLEGKPINQTEDDTKVDIRLATTDDLTTITVIIQSDKPIALPVLKESLQVFINSIPTEGVEVK